MTVKREKKGQLTANQPKPKNKRHTQKNNIHPSTIDNRQSRTEQPIGACTIDSDSHRPPSRFLSSIYSPFIPRCIRLAAASCLKSIVSLPRSERA
ncbi:hypothetical protein PGT21_032787 [Puccinia graminis f. sp. tritici]|uniref:Uncharacterized protein n=1 Tax=Puccinia graminis f. sp. tritici TaxID=56615 RepID=A0A5B0Q7Z4_PUCGR|nr:hypothetical protein PGT21_032787 [Puccinia graminis f. sp. tritici]KAA1109350.1 hypothetical protein PGTUg99_030026 [Puccinia graminis f. sp. tritici]